MNQQCALQHNQIAEVERSVCHHTDYGTSTSKPFAPSSSCHCTKSTRAATKDTPSNDHKRATWTGIFTDLRRKLFQIPSLSHSSFSRKGDDQHGRLVAEAFISTNQLTTASWKIVAVLSIAVAIILGLRFKPVYEYYEYRMPEWKWDRNIYVSNNSGTVSTSTNSHVQNGSAVTVISAQRTSLIVQVIEDWTMRKLSDVSSRPNRAYAREWKMDYAEFYAGRPSYSSKSCFDKVFVLQTLAEKQEEEAKEPSSPWPRPSRVRYDSILLLPSDAIVMEMDDNIVDNMLPNDKLVAIAGWKNSHEKLTSSSGVIIFNLEHKYTMQVANLWSKLSEESFVSCGADNGISTLIDAIAIVMDEDLGESLDNLIESITEHPSGALGRQMIKCLPMAVPGARNELLVTNLQQNSETIHQTADSVCYRFYPKCEVVP